MLDLAPEVTADEVTTLLSGIEEFQGDDHLAFRQGQRYVACLVRKPLPECQGVTLRSDGTYLITGGLGALGLKVAEWMVEQGAQHLVLISRRSAASEVQQTLNQLQQAGATVHVAPADVSSEAEMMRVFEEMQASLPPLRGVIHAAGIPGYDALKDMQPGTLEAVLRPKVVGAWILHQLTQGIPLDFFVNFSSIASVWGSKGQAHYAAANHFLDALAHYRRGLGLPALSINWGPWAGGGMAVEEFQMWMSRMGVEGLQPHQAIAALERALATNWTQITVAHVDWTLFKGIFEARSKRPILDLLDGQPEQSPEKSLYPEQKSEIIQRLEDSTTAERHSLLLTHLQAEVAKILKLPQLPDPHHGLFELGMDSLMAIEIVNTIRSQLQIELPIAEFMQASSIATLTTLLLKQLTPDDVTLELPGNTLNLNDEAVLDDSIRPAIAIATPADSSSILLTGASGFLGAFLLKELLEQTQATFYCLVRASDLTSGIQKIQKNLNSYNLWQDQYCSRIIPVIGDLSQPLLGLTTEHFETLAHQLDVIYHNGAVLNFVYPYSALKSTNVLGTQEVLRLACHAKVKPLHYVSTDAVFDSSGYFDREVTEQELIVHTAGIDLGYTQTKWVAEKLVTIARDRGLPVAIYRPPLIAGDSQTGHWNTDDFTCRFIKGCIQMGSMPNMNCGITLVPVDYVSRAIAYLSQQNESLGNTFHLNNPNYSSWSDVADWINEFGYPVRQLPYAEWEAELIAAAASGENVLSGLLPFFLKRWSEEQLSFAGFGQRRVKLNCEATVAKLSDAAIACPSISNALLNTYFSHFIKSNFLDTPKVQIGHW
jgi:thioester reductase-like protein